MGYGMICITRGKETSGQLRKLKVLLDGQCVDEIKSNETKNIRVEKGEYNLQVSMDWVKSRPLMVPVADEQTIHFRVTSPGGETTFNTFLSIIGGKMPSFELERIRL